MRRNTLIFWGLCLAVMSCFEAELPEDIDNILEGPCVDTLVTDFFRPTRKTALQAVKGPELIDQCAFRGEEANKPEVDQFLSLSTDVICILDQNFKKVLELEGGNGQEQGIKIDSLQNYAFQYMGMEIGNEDFIYVNAAELNDEQLSDRFPRWKLEPIVACGGGKTYWGALFNITTTEFSDLQFNNPK